EQIEAAAGRLRRSALQCDVLQYPVASRRAFVGKPLGSVSHRLEDSRSGWRVGVLSGVEPRSKRSCAFLKVSRRLPAAHIRRHACEVVMQSVLMIERMAEPNEARLECAQIKCFERQRLQELLYLPGCIDRRVISDGFTEKPTAHGLDRTMRKFQDRAPGGLERDGPSRLGEDWVEAADSRLGACPGDPLYDMREAIKPWIERMNPDQFENSAERRQGQHAIGLVEL